MQYQCPICKNELPVFRIPTSFRQAFWSGWTCGKCGTELNRHLKAIGKNDKEIEELKENYKKQQEKEVYETELIKEKARLQAQKEVNQEKKK